MQPREFLALADQLSAFQAIMSGSLKQETEDAKSALASLGSATELKALQKDIDAAKASFNAFKQEQTDLLDSYKADLLAKDESLSVREKVLADKEVALQALVVSSQSKVEAATDSQASLEAATAKAEARSAKFVADVEAKKAEYQSMVDDVAAREQALHAKVEALKALAQ
jgi:predicted  nucleic acid-binding Zn-ribbon protein